MPLQAELLGCPALLLVFLCACLHPVFFLTQTCCAVVYMPACAKQLKEELDGYVQGREHKSEFDFEIGTKVTFR